MQQRPYQRHRRGVCCLFYLATSLSPMSLSVITVYFSIQEQRSKVGIPTCSSQIPEKNSFSYMISTVVPPPPPPRCGFSYPRSATFRKQMILPLTYQLKVNSSLMLCDNAHVIDLTSSHHGGI